MTMAPDPDDGRRAAVMLVGNFLSRHGASRQVCEDLAEHLRGDGWRVLTVSSRRNRAARLIDMLATPLARRGDFDVAQVDVFSGPSFMWAELVAAELRLLHKPFVLTLHGGNLPVFARKHPVRVAGLFRKASLVTAPSSYLAEALSRFCDRIEVLPNGMDLSSYPFRCRAKPLPRMVWVRSLHRMYDPETAVRVLQRVLDAFPEAGLDMVGPDKGDGSLTRCRQLAASLGLGDHIRFVGGVPKRQVPGLLDQNDIFLNTTTVDNAPVSVLEAMACGLVVVSTNPGGLPYLIDDAANGYLVAPGDCEAMAGRVIEACSGRLNAGSVSCQGRALAATRDWPLVTARWGSLLRSLCGS